MFEQDKSKTVLQVTCPHCHQLNHGRNEKCACCKGNLNQEGSEETNGVEVPLAWRGWWRVWRTKLDSVEGIRVVAHAISHPRTLLAAGIIIVIVGSIAIPAHMRQSEKQTLRLELPEGNYTYAADSEYERIINALQLESGGQFNGLGTVGSASTPSTTALVENRVNFALSDRGLGEIEEQEIRLNHAIPVQRTIAYDLLVLVANLPLDPKPGALSADSIDGIFSGKIVNWKEIGGPDLKIEPILLEGLGRNAPVSHLKTVAPDTKYVKSSRDLGTMASRQEGSIVFMSASLWKRGNFNTVLRPLILQNRNGETSSPVTREEEIDLAFYRQSSPPYPSLVRPIVLIYRWDSEVKGDPSREALAGEELRKALESERGQKLLAELGYLPAYR